jgi:hypothetical protein
VNQKLVITILIALYSCGNRYISNDAVRSETVYHTTSLSEENLQKLHYREFNKLDSLIYEENFTKTSLKEGVLVSVKKRTFKDKELLEEDYQFFNPSQKVRIRFLKTDTCVLRIKNADTTYQKFDSQGRLIKAVDRDGGQVTITSYDYTNSHIPEIKVLGEDFTWQQQVKCINDTCMIIYNNEKKKIRGLEAYIFLGNKLKEKYSNGSLDVLPRSINGQPDYDSFVYLEFYTYDKKGRLKEIRKFSNGKLNDRVVYKY